MAVKEIAMQETPLITGIISLRRYVHEPDPYTQLGAKPSIRIDVECQTASGPLVLKATETAAGQLVAHLARVSPIENSQ